MATGQLYVKKVEYRNRIDRRVLPWGKAEQWGSLCATVFCELCTSTEARALSYSSVYFLGLGGGLGVVIKAILILKGR